MTKNYSSESILRRPWLLLAIAVLILLFCYEFARGQDQHVIQYRTAQECYELRLKYKPGVPDHPPQNEASDSKRLKLRNAVLRLQDLSISLECLLEYHESTVMPLLELRQLTRKLGLAKRHPLGGMTLVDADNSPGCRAIANQRNLATQQGVHDMQSYAAVMLLAVSLPNYEQDSKLQHNLKHAGGFFEKALNNLPSPVYRPDYCRNNELFDNINLPLRVSGKSLLIR